MEDRNHWVTSSSLPFSSPLSFSLCTTCPFVNGDSEEFALISMRLLLGTTEEGKEEEEDKWFDIKTCSFCPLVSLTQLSLCPLPTEMPLSPTVN